MSDEAIWVDGTELVLEASGAIITNGSFVEANDDDRQPADSPGVPFGRFEIDCAFSANPTVGAIINIHQQIINSDSVDSPDPDANYLGGFIGSIEPDLVSATQNLQSAPLAISPTGGKYWVEWVDGGSGTASLSSTWDLRLIPTTFGPAA